MAEREDEIIIEMEDEEPYALTPVEFIRNSNISNDAKVLYTIIKTYINIPNFVLYQSTLKKCMSTGDSVFKRAWKELKDLGYLKQYKKHINGRYKYSYKLSSKGNAMREQLQEVEKQPVVNQPVEKEQVELHTDCNLDTTNTTTQEKDYKNLDSSSKSDYDNNEFDKDLIEYEGMYLTDDQYYQIEKLIHDAFAGKIDASKGNIISYCQKRYDSTTRNFKKKNGEDIKSIYGYVKSTFKIKSEQDELKSKSKSIGDYSYY